MTAPAPAKANPKTILLTKKAGLPVWAWALLSLGVLVLVMQWRKNKSASSSSSSSSATGTTDNMSQLPVIILPQGVPTTTTGGNPWHKRHVPTDPTSTTGTPSTGDNTTTPPAGGSGTPTTTTTTTPASSGQWVTVTTYTKSNPPWNSTIWGIWNHFRTTSTWQDVWNAPENASLRSLRGNPNSIRKDDRVFVPGAK